MISLSSCCGYSGKQVDQTASGRPNTLAPFVDDTYIQEGRESPFGLDYIFPLVPEFRNPEIVRDFGEVVKVRWVDFSQVTWDTIEPKPPKNGNHVYDWSGLDEAVRQWEHYGVHIMITLKSSSRWGTITPSGKENVYLKGGLKLLTRGASYLPKPEHMQDYRDYIYNLVRRYDGDGIDDMPGLRFPILHYQIENEVTNEMNWGGSADEYGVFLKESYEAARKANSNVKIILAGLNYDSVYGFYDKNMDPLTRAFVEKNLTRVTPTMRKYVERSMQFTMRAMQFCSWYDIYDVRWPFYGYVVKSREFLDKFGCQGKEIWSAETYCNPPFLPKEPIIPNTTVIPYTAPSQSEEYIKIANRPGDKEFPKFSAWYRGLQAAYVVKECMPALQAGSKKIMMGYAVDAQSFLAGYPWSIMGLRSKTFNKLWPCAYSYKQLIEKLDGFRSCTRLQMPENVYVYECIVKGGKKVLVAFYDDHIAQNMDEPQGTTNVEIPFAGNDAKVTHVISELDQKEAKVDRIKVMGGKIKMDLTEYPVFIEPVIE